MSPAAGPGRPRVYFHIGPMKSGTSHLQTLMTANADALRDAGVLFPLDRGKWSLQSHGVNQFRLKGAAPPPRSGGRPPWEVLREQVLAHPGASVVSMEFLSFYTAEEARGIVAAFPDHEAHVVLTLRDAQKLVPSVWQNAGRNGRIEPWTDFVANLAAPGPSRAKRFFRHRQGVAHMLEAWTSAVPAERVHVITVPGSDAPRTELWSRFASVIGVDHAVATAPAARSNESLGYPSAELARRVNHELGPQPRGALRTASKKVLSGEELVRRKDSEPAVPVDPTVLRFGARWNRRTRATLEEYGVRVVGDLDELPVAEGTPTVDALAEPDLAAVLDAGEFAVSRMRARVEERVAAKAVTDVPDATRRFLDATSSRAAWEAGADPAGAAAAEVLLGVHAYAALITD